MVTATVSPFTSRWKERTRKGRKVKPREEERSAKREEEAEDSEEDEEDESDKDISFFTYNHIALPTKPHKAFR